MWEKIKGWAGYVKSRLNERSTWVAFGTGVTGAAALPMPWSAIFVVIAVVGVLIPDGSAVKPKQ